ncbi:MAG: portal protein, partial [Alphaproteobacteria bacterium]
MHDDRMPGPGEHRAERTVRRFRTARDRRAPWEALWRDCFDQVMPHRTPAGGSAEVPRRAGERLFDGTAPDAVEQLAASLMAELTPPW